jgi:hypothetical protein
MQLLDAADTEGSEDCDWKPGVVTATCAVVPSMAGTVCVSQGVASMQDPMQIQPAARATRGESGGQRGDVRHDQVGQ